MAEVRLAIAIEDFGNSEAGTARNLLVQVDKIPTEARCDKPTHGRLTRAHVAGEEDAFQRRSRHEAPSLNRRNRSQAAFILVVFVIQPTLDLLPQVVARFMARLEEGLGGFRYGFEITDQCRAVRIGSKKGLQARVFRDFTGSTGEEIRKNFFELGRRKAVEIHIAQIAHWTSSRTPASSGGSWSGWRSSSRNLSRALWSCDLELPVEHSSIVAISLCSKPSTSCRTKTMR